MKKTSVGQKLWLVLHRHRNTAEEREVTVVKVGRKWAELDYPFYSPYKISLEHWHIDGGKYSSPGSCYASEQDYKDTVVREALWRKFQQRVSWATPENITTERIKELAVELGVILD